MEEIFIALVFIVAVVFMAKTLYKQYTTDKGCSVGCASCEITEEVKKEIKLPDHLKP
ncbi:MAG: hypothetical protein ACJAS3_001292 [Roseivirga sp.]|jgi:hypothetical protein